ncbi:MAG: hypothetical protein HIU83_13550 [Proteobacteria bacterium]|nr:hypothetical protein [Pseudomonadota bacterium]
MSGKINTGEILKITGKNLMQENRSKWRPQFRSATAYGFEGANPRDDGFCSAGFCMGRYDSDIKLSGGKSAIFSVAGGSGPYPDYIESFNGISLWAQNFYGRTYFRYTNNSGVWPDNALKFIDIQGTSNNIYIQPIGSVTAPDSFRVVDNGKNYYGKIPGGAIKSDRWYLLEWQYSSSNSEVKVWIDNKLIITAPLTATTQNYIEFGIVNAFSTPSKFALTLRLDNLAISTTRLHPSSLIEISNNERYGEGTVRYQEPIYLSDGIIKIKADLAGLGSGPYYLWITNNEQSRSAAQRLGRMDRTKHDAIAAGDEEGMETHAGITKEMDPGEKDLPVALAPPAKLPIKCPPKLKNTQFKTTPV